MPGTRIFTISVAFFAATLGAQPDYFPLQPGNQWIYRCSGLCSEEAPVLEIVREADFSGLRYSLFRGFHGLEAWLRQDGHGVLWALDPATNQENRWYSFFAPEGEPFDTSVDPCSPSASIRSRQAQYDGPPGSFPNAVHVVYGSGQCADAGITEEFFLPQTGLVRRTELTIAGPRTYDLIYSRAGGVVIIAEPHLSFTLSIDRALYFVNFMPPVDPRRLIPQMTARLTLRNTTREPIRLTFPSSQQFEVEIRNEKGEVVWRWSDGRAFLTAFGEEQFGPGERNYTVLAPLADANGRPLPEGRYRVEAWITTTDPKAYAASVEFEIRNVF